MLKKKFLKTKCKIEFVFPANAAAQVQSVHLVGDFNSWDKVSHPMAMDKKGQSYSLTLELPLGQSFQFRYLVNNQDWHNDWEADAYAPNSFGGENSVVKTEAPAE